MNILGFQVNCLFFNKEDSSGQNVNISQHSGNCSAYRFLFILCLTSWSFILRAWLSVWPQTQVDPCANFWSFLCITLTSLVTSLLEFFLPASQSERTSRQKARAGVGLTSFPSHLSEIPVLYCLLSNDVCKQLFHIFCLVF